MHASHNAFDLSFESGFPDCRWLSDNVVEFYYKEFFDKGSDSLTIKNSTDKTIKYLRVLSENEFLILDIAPGSGMTVRIPAARGDSQSISVEGAFNDEVKIGFAHNSFD
jgi:hypothetical protein